MNSMTEKVAPATTDAGQLLPEQGKIENAFFLRFIFII